MSSKDLFSILLFIGLPILSTFAQINPESIEIRKNGYFQYDEKLSYRDMSELMAYNDSAFEAIKSARANNTAAQIISFTGGFLIGLPLGAAITGDDPNWTLAAVGAGLVVVSIPFAVKSKNKTTEAIEEYNSSDKIISKRQVEYSFNMQPTGMGLTLRF